MIRTLSRSALLSAFSFTAFAQAFAFTGVTVIDPRSRSVSTNQIVLVDAGIIKSVGMDNGRVPRGAQEIRARSRYLIPGLWDAHAHLSKAGELALPLFV